MIDGTEIKMGGETYIVPPLNFKRLKKIQPLLAKLSTLTPTAGDVNEEQFDAAVEIVHLALTRNYPDLEREKVEELIDLRNLPFVMAAIMGQSGLVKAGE